jgi:hypothetical protein
VIATQSGHNIQDEQPELVLDAIRNVQAVRTGTQFRADDVDSIFDELTEQDTRGRRLRHRWTHLVSCPSSVSWSTTEHSAQTTRPVLKLPPGPVACRTRSFEG